MPFGTITIGGCEFRETEDAQRTSDGSVSFSGQEAHPPRSKGRVRAAAGNLAAMDGLVVPVVFTDKGELTGFYAVDGARVNYHKWAEGAVETATYDVQLSRIGSAKDVEIESRVPTIGRQTDTGLTPVFWHAPAVGARSYFTGSTVPANTVTRTGSEGVVKTYLGIPSGVAPRWVIGADQYMNGSARILYDGLRRIGLFTPPLAIWQIDNTLLRVMAGNDGTFLVSAWDASGWKSQKEFRVTVAGTPLTGQPEVTILRNDPEEAAVRFTYDTTTGRTTVDLSLRRGSRFVSGIVKRHGAANLAVELVGAETGTAITGGVRATAADADGNRLVLASARTVTVSTNPIRVTRNAATSLDFMVGHEIDGSTAQAGDTAADLVRQYLGSTGERVRIVKR